MKETWGRYRTGFLFLTLSFTLALAPTMHLNESENWCSKLFFIMWILLGSFVLSVMLSTLIEMEVNKRLEGKE